MKRLFFVCGLICLLAAVVIAHPHIQKSINAKVGDVEVKLEYYTSPANMEHVKTAEVGSFSPGARLTISADLGSVAAGEYTVGAIKGDSGWAMAVYPGQIPRGEKADMSKVVKLDSMLSKEHGMAAHSHFDINPGAGSLEGKTCVTWHFGPLFLAGAIN
jgi:hypothetical protein